MITDIIEPDGSGKMTMIRRLVGLLPPSADVKRVEGRIGYLPQKFGLYEKLSVMENLELCARLHGVDRKTMLERGMPMFKAVNMDRFTDRHFGKLSGGMKQKAVLVCALISKPDMLLLDELTVACAIPLTMLSGLNTPVTSMPDCLQKFALMNPVRWSIDALQQFFLQGAGFEAVAVPIAILTVIGIVSFLAAWLKFRRC